MIKLTHHEVIILLLQISLMLIFAKVFSEIAKKLKQPAVVGEILAGIILGPTVIGTLFPEFINELFEVQKVAGNLPVDAIPRGYISPLLLNGFISISMVLLLFIAGLEVELPVVINQGKRALLTSVFGILICFTACFSVAYFYPSFFGVEDVEQELIFSMFLGVGISISALAVVARNLMDLGIFKSKIGMVIIASAMLDDFLGWTLFSIILGMIGTKESSILFTLFSTIAFTVFMLTLGKSAINRSLPYINRYFTFPGGVLAFSIIACFLGAALTEYIGIHAVFGAFIVGVALGDSVHMTTKTKEIIHDFVNNVFAPLFFVSIGLQINFLTHFNISYILVILALAFIGKAVGSWLGAFLGGLNPKDSLIVGFGMNARGSVDVIFATLALEAGIINQDIFVALVIMALITSMTSGTLVKYLTRGRVPRKENGDNKVVNQVEKDRIGVVFYGANELSYLIAKYLRDNKIPIMMLDPSKENLVEAKHLGIPAHSGNILESDLLETFDFSEYAKLCAVSNNNEDNLEIDKIFAEEFGENEVYRLISKKEAKSASLSLPKNLLFRGYWYYNYIHRILAKKPPLRQIRLETEESLNNFIFINKKRIVPLLVHKPNKKIEFISSYHIAIDDGDILVYFDIDKEARKQSRKERKKIMSSKVS